MCSRFSVTNWCEIHVKGQNTSIFEGGEGKISKMVFMGEGWVNDCSWKAESSTVDLYVCHSLHLDFLVPILPNHPLLPYDGEYLSPYLWIILQNIHMISLPFLVDVLSDEVPVQVHLEAFNPCVPLDSKNSGIPVVVLNYTVTNSSKDAAKVNYFVMIKHPHKSGVRSVITHLGIWVVMIMRRLYCLVTYTWESHYVSLTLTTYLGMDLC